MSHLVRCAGSPVAVLEDGAVMDPRLSPRPYLHPVLTPAGALLTELGPADHAHHAGVSLALPDVNGTMHWGGQSYVHPGGYQWLDNHGRQELRSLRTAAPTRPAGTGRTEGSTPGLGTTTQASIEATVDWLARDSHLQATEQRSIRVLPLAAGEVADGYRLSWRSELTGTEDLTIGSPGSHGRDSAGYGGLFWRLPAPAAWRLLAPGGLSEEQANGTVLPWIAYVSDTQHACLVLRQSPQDPAPVPWFIRVAEYPGAGPALAWDTDLHVPAGQVLRIGLDALVLDQAPSEPDQLGDLLHHAGWTA